MIANHFERCGVCHVFPCVHTIDSLHNGAVWLNVGGRMVKVRPVQQSDHDDDDRDLADVVFG